MNIMSEYEQGQLEEIKKWKDQKPCVATSALRTVFKPVEWVVNAIVPESAIIGALNATNFVARYMADKGDILSEGGVSDINQLRTKDLRISDKIADSVHNWAIGLATTEGGITGAGGALAMAIDIPTTLTLALRTIHKIGLCYGYSADSESEKQFVLQILSIVGSNSQKEKIESLVFIKGIRVALRKKTWKAIQKASVKGAPMEAGIATIRKLAKQLGLNMTKRKAMQVMPLIGGAVGATINGEFLREIGWAARRCYQERWLLENGKIAENAI